MCACVVCVKKIWFGCEPLSLAMLLLPVSSHLATNNKPVISSWSLYVGFLCVSWRVRECQRHLLGREPTATKRLPQSRSRLFSRWLVAKASAASDLQGTASSMQDEHKKCKQQRQAGSRVEQLCGRRRQRSGVAPRISVESRLQRRRGLCVVSARRLVVEEVISTACPERG